MDSIGILLINLGTPEQPTYHYVKKYLTEFLTDPRVIDLPFIIRQLLVRGYIVPKRYKQSTHLYQKIWDSQTGSPLLKHSQDLTKQLSAALGPEYHVGLAMRYQNPSIKAAVTQLKFCKKLIIFPLFPQYASATTGSAHEKVMEIVKKWTVIPQIHFINHYFDHPAFIDSHVTIAKSYKIADYDHVLFSYHGLPIRQVYKADPYKLCLRDKNCCKKNTICYSSQCFHTTLAIAKRLEIPQEKWSISFQSRLGKMPWLQPYGDQVIKNLAKNGCKSLLVFTPSFTADCLETIEEIGSEYKDLFIQHGGKDLELVPSLNSHPSWVQGIQDIIQDTVSNRIEN